LLNQHTFPQLIQVMPGPRLGGCLSDIVRLSNLLLYLLTYINRWITADFWNRSFRGQYPSSCQTNSIKSTLL